MCVSSNILRAFDKFGESLWVFQNRLENGFAAHVEHFNVHQEVAEENDVRFLGHDTFLGGFEEGRKYICSLFEIVVNLCEFQPKLFCQLLRISGFENAR